MKKIFASIAAVVMLIMGVVGAGCEQEPVLSTTNERLDSTEKQLTYQTDSMKWYTIEEAYENGWFTQTDLAYAMYYAQGKVYTCKKSDWEKNDRDKIKQIDFIPTEECPALDKQVELDIKRDYYNDMSSENIPFEEFAENISFRFVGSYHGTFVLTDTNSAYWGYPGVVPPPVYIAGFVWSPSSHASDLFVLRYE